MLGRMLKTIPISSSSTSRDTFGLWMVELESKTQHNSGEGMMKPKKSRLQSFLKLVAWYDCGTGCSFKCYYFRGTTQFSSDSADNNGPEFHQTESCLCRNRQHHIPMQFGKHDWHAYNVHVRAARFSFRFASRRISHPRPRSRRRRIGCF
jgi:hypothetical protein